MAESRQYYIFIHRSDKRITIVFRGSVTSKDWIIDLNACSTQPEELNRFAREKGGLLNDGEEINIHSGFAKYLFDKRRGVDKSKFDEILDDLEDIFSYKDEETGHDYCDYSLFVTGHSLGGALAQLLSFTLASRDPKDVKYTMPITVVTYASPRVGKSVFAKVFQKLEKQGLLRHIRVTNDKDVVPIVPPFYKQTGINIHLYPEDALNEVDVSYNKKSPGLTSQLRLSSFDVHSIEGYNRNLFAHMERSDHPSAEEGKNIDHPPAEEDINIWNKTVKELYKDYANIDL
jgi:predicted lipase